MARLINKYCLEIQGDGVIYDKVDWYFKTEMDPQRYGGRVEM